MQGKLAAQSHVYYKNLSLLRKVFAAGYAAGGLPLQPVDDQLGNVYRQCFLYSASDTGELSEEMPKGLQGEISRIQLPPNLSVYRQERGVHLMPGIFLYFCYGSGMEEQALVNLVATEREINSGATAQWAQFVRVKLTNVKRTYGYLEARRWLRAYQVYYDDVFFSQWELLKL